MSVILACIAVFIIYTSDYYRADERAWEATQKEYVLAKGDGDYLVSRSENAKAGLIFYPGAKVETEAYLPLLCQIAAYDIDCFLVDMPFHLAFFGADAAESIIQNNKHIKEWYVAGHSLGGVMASQFASKNQDVVSGLILLASYPYKEFPLEKTLKVYGELDTSVAKKITYTENVYVIEGGNHAQFGNYGKQRGDAEAEISAEDQQAFTVAKINYFVDIVIRKGA